MLRIIFLRETKNCCIANVHMRNENVHSVHCAPTSMSVFSQQKIADFVTVMYYVTSILFSILFRIPAYRSSSVYRFRFPKQCSHRIKKCFYSTVLLQSKRARYKDPSPTVYFWLQFRLKYMRKLTSLCGRGQSAMSI